MRDVIMGAIIAGVVVLLVWMWFPLPSRDNCINEIHAPWRLPDKCK
jgi:membrane-associated phospholipid phosphatase